MVSDHFIRSPVSALNIVVSNLWVCRIAQTIIVQISFHMSRLGFVGLAVDRFVAIVYPLKYRKWGKTSTGWITVAVFLAITVIVNGPYFMYTEVSEPGTFLETKYCFNLMRHSKTNFVNCFLHHFSFPVKNISYLKAFFQFFFLYFLHVTTGNWGKKKALSF